MDGEHTSKQRITVDYKVISIFHTIINLLQLILTIN